ncbi:MAG TPA: hypothetical protein VIJ95_14560 [Hanamia sp.]
MNKKLILKFLCLYLIIQAISPAKVTGQIIISGTVYDSSRLYTIPDVYVYSTSGSRTVTDSTGTYHIGVNENDSISFFYNGKSTIKFPVRSMIDYTAFDISLGVRVKGKYKLLSPVTVFSNSYQKDSLENREEFSKLFGGEKRGIHPNIDPGGAAGFDLDALIRSFQFKKNKENLAFKKMLIQQEQDDYVDYRFSSKVISRVTGLKGEELELYKKLYRPTYFFIVTSTLAEFYQYILSTSYAFKKQEGSQ